ncbi:DUF559 domain-containing protein [Asanoa sp. WMMD1127]|uniref:DUF559 domain-containing protein n=1 Tax=Asanoa sp. WMMD1127 TaxID=3016107 RepID=UPI002417E050|nr:DUF559 domain-containing protein [Asanoa sp. WMMD1127]MDG4827499.1 DUF559 domain-containing protein [Asanoa sp. WMMD1127]
MDRNLAVALASGGGVLHWVAGGPVPRWSIDDGCRSGRLIRLLPGVFVDAACAADVTVRRRAALAYAGGAALSHQTALAVWGLLSEPPAAPVHVTTGRGATIRSWDWLEVHREGWFARPEVVVRGGFPVSRIERALVQAWPSVRREPVIRAVNERLTTAGRLADLVSRTPRVAGRAELTGLLRLLAAGCRSELEIWGHDRVFTGPGMPPLARQVPVSLGARTVYLDLFAEAERVNFELDGASVHADPRQREIDLRRDAALAALGILVVRFSRRRLVSEPAEVRREALAILRRRGRQIW